MEICKSILRILDTQMEVPAPYGGFHLLWLAIVVVASVLLAKHGRKMDSKNVNRVVLVMAIVTICLEIYKQINFTFV